MAEKLEALIRKFRAARYPNGFRGRNVTDEFKRRARANRREESEEAEAEAFEEFVGDVAEEALREVVDAGKLRTMMRPKAGGSMEVVCHPVGPGPKAAGGTRDN